MVPPESMQQAQGKERNCSPGLKCDWFRLVQNMDTPPTLLSVGGKLAPSPLVPWCPPAERLLALGHFIFSDRLRWNEVAHVGSNLDFGSLTSCTTSGFNSSSEIYELVGTLCTNLHSSLIFILASVLDAGKVVQLDHSIQNTRGVDKLL